MAKNFFQKIGLIEVNEPVEEFVSVEVEVEVESVPDVNIDGLTETNTVNTVYELNGLNDERESIFAAENFMKTLPVEMPKDAKRASVLGIIAAAGMSVEAVMNDGANRLAILDAALLEKTEYSNQLIALAEEAISKLSAQIESNKTTIYETKAAQAQVDEQIEAECKRIVELMKFLEGEK